MEIRGSARHPRNSRAIQMVGRTGVATKSGAFVALGLIVLMTFLILWSEPGVEAQIITTEREQVTLASVQVGDSTVSVIIAYQGDSALLTAAIPGSGGKSRYIPLMGSTYRGLPSFQLDVLSSTANDEIWLRLSQPRSEVLAHYRLGGDTALTQFGRIQLLATPFPEYLSGGPLPFPREGLNVARLRASIFHYDDDG